MQLRNTRFSVLIRSESKAARVLKISRHCFVLPVRYDEFERPQRPLQAFSHPLMITGLGLCCLSELTFAVFSHCSKLNSSGLSRSISTLKPKALVRSWSAKGLLEATSRPNTISPQCSASVPQLEAGGDQRLRTNILGSP